MYKVILGLVLVAAVAAADVKKGQVPAYVAAMYGKPQDVGPEPCCVPAYYTAKYASQVTYVGFEGKLVVENVISEYAYDSIEEKIAAKVDLGFSNGTKETYSYLEFYEEGYGYEVYDLKDYKECFKYSLDSSFEKECVADAVYVGSTTIGDRDLYVNSWYTNTVDAAEDIHIVETTTKECVPLSISVRSFDTETQEELYTTSLSVFDFSLGICEEKEIFTIPEICEKAEDICAKVGHKVRRSGHKVVSVGK